MRPRVFPAEDSATNGTTNDAPPRFNEAAGIPRGRRPVNTCGLTTADSFNEAAGIPRGRRAAVSIRQMRP